MITNKFTWYKYAAILLFSILFGLEVRTIVRVHKEFDTAGTFGANNSVDVNDIDYPDIFPKSIKATASSREVPSSKDDNPGTTTSIVEDGAINHSAQGLVDDYDNSEDGGRVIQLLLPRRESL